MNTGCTTCVLYVRIEVQGETLFPLILKQHHLFDTLKYRQRIHFNNNERH